jgi:hypothetical protein
MDASGRQAPNRWSQRRGLTSRTPASRVQPYMSSLSTEGLGGMQTDEVAFEGLRRAVAAFNDLDTVAVLQKSL